MKKLMIFLMAALVLTGTLLVSCNQNVGEDKLSSVTISEDMARSLSTSITTNVKPVDQLTWYYKATKMDNGFFATGQTSDWTKVPGEGTGLVNKSLGKMSYGDWKFEFQGRDYTGETVYKVVFFCDGLYETINSDETMLTVPLAQGEGFDEAGIIFENLIFTLDGVDVNNSVKIGSTISSVQLVVTETGTQQSWIFYGEEYHAATEATDTEPAKPAYISFTPASTTRVKYTTSSSHPYQFAVKYNDNDIIEPFDFPVYIQLGYDMTISGDINAFEQQSEVTIEKTSETWTVQTAYTQDTAVNDMTATTDATPAKLADATSEGKTTVKASSAALIKANGNYDGEKVANSVKVTVSSTETASVTFAATDDTSAFAGIDLKLMQIVTKDNVPGDPEEVLNADFGANPVTVETYIAKNLTNVVLTYPADSEAAQPKASTDSTEIANHKAHVMTASEAQDETTLGYYPVTGLLRFTTTHFSEFAVFADQYIFDKTANTAYKLDNAGLLDGGEFKNDHEYILLDPTKANLVSDDIDVFNASKSNWTVLHDSSDVENTTDFAGGYGTKIEPYLINSHETMQNITRLYNSVYNYFAVADGTTTIDCTGWTPVYLHGSFNGRTVHFTNVTANLFQTVGYQLNTERIALMNFDATMNVSANGQYGAAALVKNIFNSGVTTFENVDVHGYLEGYWNMGSFYNYGTTNYDNVGSNYEVVFNNCTSDATIVCASGNVIGGLFGHSYEGNGNSFTLRVNSSEYTGHMYLTTTNGKGNKYYGMTSDYYNVHNHFYFDGVEDTFDNGSSKNAGAYTNSTKISNVTATKGTDGYLIAKQDDASKISVTITAQLTAFDSLNQQIANLSGITMVLSSGEINEFAGDSIKVLDLFGAIDIANNASSFDAYVSNGTLFVKLQTSSNYQTGVVRLQVNQYDADGNILSAGTLDIAERQNLASEWVIK